MISTYYTHLELFAARREMQGTVGLVPTMGYLHEGHLSLVRQALAENDHAVVTIFVNPTQFGPTEDLAKYPRNIMGDLDKISQLGDVLVWLPDSAEMYPEGYQTWVNVTELTKPLEGEMRPGHFKGVTTVVAKLFNAVQPTVAYFGQKDFQQAAVIQQMARDLSYPIRIEVCPTVREPDGLAMSSRNSYLSVEERHAAPILRRGLQKAEEAYLSGERSAANLVDIVRSMISQEPLAAIQYIHCSDKKTLLPADTITAGAVISLAVFFGKTRLIDNIILG